MSLPQQFSLYMGEFSQIEIIFDVSSSHKFSLHMKLLSWIQWLDCY